MSTGQPRNQLHEAPNAMDTGVYVIDRGELAELDKAIGKGSSRRREDQSDVIRDVRERVWEALSTGRFEPPRLPHVASEVLRLSQDDDASLSDLAGVIHQDQFLAGECLRIANSLHYAPRGGRRVTSLAEALARLGFNKTRNVVLAAAMQQSIYRGPRVKLMMDLWHAALGSAVAFSLLSQCSKRDADQAFLIGLMHDVGKPVVASVLDDVLDETGGNWDYESLADDLFHLMHARAGSRIVKHWKLPGGFSRLVEHHHDLQPPPELQEPAWMLRLADLVYGLWLREGDGVHAFEPLLGHRLVHRLGIQRVALQPILALYPGVVRSYLGSDWA